MSDVIERTCVYVREILREWVEDSGSRSKPQDGGVYTKEHTHKTNVLLVCCCFVMSHNDVIIYKKRNNLTSHLTSRKRWSYGR